MSSGLAVTSCCGQVLPASPSAHFRIMARRRRGLVFRRFVSLLRRTASTGSAITTSCNSHPTMPPIASGITRVNLATGATKLIISHHQLATTGDVPQNFPDSKHHAYHLLCSPDGQRFILLHRWTQPKGGHLTRLITAAMDGSDWRIVIPNGYVSHFVWRDAAHILAQSKGWRGNDQPGDFLFEDQPSGIVAEIGRGVLDPAGHLTYLRHNQ